jgi:hydrogenase maturation factor HypE
LPASPARWRISDCCINGAANDSGISALRIADDAGFVNFFASDANVGECSNIPLWNVSLLGDIALGPRRIHQRGVAWPELRSRVLNKT